MEPDELIAAAQDAQPPQQQQGSPWDGRVAVNRQTGQRVVWRSSPTGRGRWVALSAETADPQARERVSQLQDRVGVGQRTVNLGRRFIDTNVQHRSGGVQNDPNLPLWMRPQGAQQMQALSDQMIGANWVPGTSTMMNTATEQEMARRRYPAPGLRGDVNRDIYFNMIEDLAVQEQALQSMRQHLSQNPNLDGWDAAWAQREPEVRRAARANAEQELYRRYGRRGGQNTMIDLNGNVIR